MYPDTKIAQLEKILTDKGVKYCIGAYVDIHGVPKGKVVPISHLRHMAHGSERYTGYALYGLGQAPNDDEITSITDELVLRASRPISVADIGVAISRVTNEMPSFDDIERARRRLVAAGFRAIA